MELRAKEKVRVHMTMDDPDVGDCFLEVSVPEAVALFNDENWHRGDFAHPDVRIVECTYGAFKCYTMWEGIDNAMECVGLEISVKRGTGVTLCIGGFYVKGEVQKCWRLPYDPEDGYDPLYYDVRAAGKLYERVPAAAIMEVLS